MTPHREPRDAPPAFISKLQHDVAKAVELVMAVVLGGFAVSVLSNLFVAVVPRAYAWLTAGSVLVMAVTYLVLRRFTSLRTEVSFEGFLLQDAKAHALIPVPNYQLSEDCDKLLRAAFAENKALEAQWKQVSLGFIGLEEGEEPASHKLLRELLEYIVLERLSLHLSEYFNSDEFEKSRLQEYKREDIPALLLKNRFLELFSRPMQDRPPFAQPETRKATVTREVWVAGKQFRSGDVCYQTGPGGAIFSKFDLTLPAKSEVVEVPGGGVRINAPAIQVSIEPIFEGFHTVLPQAFVERYAKVKHYEKNGKEIQPRTYELSVGVRIASKVKMQTVLSNKSRDYHMWAESFCAELEEYFSSDAFFARISWPTVEALLICGGTGAKASAGSEATSREASEGTSS